MNLYEITNGLEGNSYVRVYVWAENEEQALLLAEKQFNKAGYPPERGLSQKFLFLGDSKPFCSIPSDDGFVLPRNA